MNPFHQASDNHSCVHFQTFLLFSTEWIRFSNIKADFRSTRSKHQQRQHNTSITSLEWCYIVIAAPSRSEIDYSLFSAVESIKRAIFVPIVKSDWENYWRWLLLMIPAACRTNMRRLSLLCLRFSAPILVTIYSENWSISILSTQSVAKTFSSASDLSRHGCVYSTIEISELTVQIDMDSLEFQIRYSLRRTCLLCKFIRHLMETLNRCKNGKRSGGFYSE